MVAAYKLHERIGAANYVISGVEEEIQELLSESEKEKEKAED